MTSKHTPRYPRYYNPYTVGLPLAATREREERERDERLKEERREMYNALQMLLRADEVATGKHRGTLTIHHVAKVTRAILARIDGKEPQS